MYGKLRGVKVLRFHRNLNIEILKLQNSFALKYRVAHKKVLLRLSLVTLINEQLESKLKIIQQAKG